MSLAHFTTGAIWIVFFLGAALAAPPKPSSEAQPKFENDSVTQNGMPTVKATPENNRTEPAAKTFGSDLKSEFLAQPKFEEDSQMQNGQPKVKAIPENNRTEPAAKTFGGDLTSEFLAQPKFEDDSGMQNGLPKVKAIPENNKTEPAAKTFGAELPSEFPEEAECQNSWQRFMVDFEVHYASEAETQKRRSIFCDNWKRIQEHNTLYEEGKESYKMSTNRWSDLTSEELKIHIRNIPTFPPNMEEPGIYAENTNASEVDHKGINCQAAFKKFLVDFSPKYENDAETEKRHSIFCDNWKRIQEHNAQYEAGVVSHKKRINEWSDLTFEEWKKSQKPFFALNMETPGNKTEERDPFPPNLEEPGIYVVKTTIKPEEPRIEESKEPTNSKVHGNKTEPSGGNPKDIKCQAAWKKFLADYSPKYENDAETKIRRSIFCSNWKRIQKHNALYDLGKVPHAESISVWSDLTSKELQNQSPNILPPNLRPPEHKTEETIVEVGPQQVWFPFNVDEPGTYILKTNASEVDDKGINCQDAWEKFLVDFAPKYENDAETEKRRSIFCDNLKRIQEHNALYESGEVTDKKSINQWSDMTSEELKNQNPNILPPNLRPSEHKREATIVEVGSQQIWFPPNMEEPGTYVEETTVKPIVMDEELTDEVPRIE